MPQPRKFTDTEKYCPHCKTWKLHKEFHKHASEVSGLCSLCTSCETVYQRPFRKQYHKKNREKIIKKATQWNKTNKDKRKKQRCYDLEVRRNYERRSKYGLSPEQYKQMWEEQRGKCALPSCGKDIAHVDHDHITGIVRGLLCQTCNGALGLFYDNSALMRNAADYIDKHKGII